MSGAALHFTSELRHDDAVERAFTLGEVPGILWRPVDDPAPSALVLLGHPGGLDQMYPRVAGRARHYVARFGFAAATIELPGSGRRPRLPAADRARADAARTELRRSLSAGEAVDDATIDALVLPLVDRSVPEWQETLDALRSLPGLGCPVGLEGGVIAVGVRMAAVDSRVSAAVFFAGTAIPRATLDEARRVTIPLQLLLQWDDEHNDRDRALALFDAFGSAEKTLHANVGGHTGVPAFELAAAGRFFARHLT